MSAGQSEHAGAVASWSGASPKSCQGRASPLPSRSMPSIHGRRLLWKHWSSGWLVGNRSRQEPKGGGGVAGAGCQGSTRPSRVQLVSNRLRFCCVVGAAVFAWPLRLARSILRSVQTRCAVMILDWETCASGTVCDF